MLAHLSISNFAVVKQLSVQLENGLTAITGETGAGKSIAIDALSLCLGERADANAVRKGSAKAEIIAHTMIVIQDDKNPDNIDVFTALRNSAHYNVNSLFEEEENREPSKDSITLVHGLLGSYPDAFWYINASEITSSIEKLKSIKSEADYKALLDDVGMRRTNPNFWAFSDKLMQWSSKHYPIEGGLLDYNRLEDR